MELKQLHEEMQKAWAELKTANDAREAEIKKHGEASAETKTKVEALNTGLSGLEKKITDTIAAQEKRLGEVETKLNRPDFRGQGDDKKPSEAKTAFLKWARTGELTPEERKMLLPTNVEGKVLTIGDATQAGYLAPVEYVREILKGVVEFSPLRSVARVRTTTAKAIQIPKRTGTFAASWVAETGTRAETTGLKYGLEEIAAHELYGLVDVSFAMLEDSAFDLEAELRVEFAEQFGVAEGTAFISGNAVGKPEGITTNTAVGTVNSGSASAITADGLIKLFYGLKDAYAQAAVWVMRRATIQEVRLLKDTTNRYLWAPGLDGSQASEVLGKQIIEAVDMPAIAAGNKPISFGDFRRGYTIVDRLEIAVVRDPYTQAASGNIRFHARKRVGGQVTIAEAIKLQNIAV
ncbi:MAG: phage major capsid protein [Armatimonadota bacterium]